MSAPASLPQQDLAPVVASTGRSGQLIAAGVLGLLGLATAFVYIHRANPHTMVLFMGPGLLLEAAALVIFTRAVSRDIKDRLSSIKNVRFAAGEVIYERDGPADRLYIVNEGEVALVMVDPDGKEGVVAHVLPGQYFGGVSLMARKPRQTTARAVTAVEALAINQGDFEALYRYLPNVHSEIEKRRQQLALRSAEEQPSAGP